MTIQSVSYSEYGNDTRAWQIGKCEFQAVTLVLGKNATGKTRLLRVINGLCKILSGDLTKALDSGSYEAEFLIAEQRYLLSLTFDKGKIVAEKLTADGDVKLERDQTGRGRAFFEKERNYIEFQVPSTVIAIQQRRDELQHPYIARLAEWASKCRMYEFGSSFGRDRLIGLSNLQIPTSDETTLPIEGEDCILSYYKGFNQFKEDFDKAILSDMRLLQYDLSDVGVADIRQLLPGATSIASAEPVLSLFVREVDREGPLPQIHMSQGMFRALAFVIHINLAKFSKRKALVLVDDVGEGLDYQRSSSIINFLMGAASEFGLQVIMTSNDQFVMNNVPLENWMILRRKGGRVHAYSEKNSAKDFAEFRYMGLNNFELFASSAFE